MKVYGLKGGIEGKQNACKGVPYISEGSGLISKGPQEDPFIPTDYWDEYVEKNRGVKSFPQVVSVPSLPVVCIWDQTIDYLFQEGVSEVNSSVCQRKGNSVFGIFTKPGFVKFEKLITKKIKKDSEESKTKKEEISASIYLFGKTPELIASWKLLKAFH